MLKNHPHIKFHINRTLDKKMAHEFIDPVNNKEVGGVDFMYYILKMHPKLKGCLKLDRGARKAFIGKYVYECYAKDLKKLEVKKKEFQKRWDIVEEKFFDNCAIFFGDSYWPKGRYISYVSIFDMGPRFLESCTFQTFWKLDNFLIDTIAHELLHFKFYDFWGKNFKGKMNEGQIWHLSEIFNDIVQSDDKFVEIQGHKTNLCYPDHKKLFNRYCSLWEKSNRSAKVFIEKSIPEIKKDFKV